MAEWATYTPDGRRLVIRREQDDTWTVICGEDSEARSDLLDVALIEAIRQDRDLLAHSLSERLLGVGASRPIASRRKTSSTTVSPASPATTHRAATRAESPVLKPL